MTTPLCCIYDKAFLTHLTGTWHPERPARLKAIDQAISSIDFAYPILHIIPRMATEDEIALCHSKEYIHLVQHETSQIITKHLPDDGSICLSTGDAPICSKSYNIARLAAGGALTAVDAVMQNTSLRAFVAARPPGHHAHRDIGHGFCIFNNIAIAAKYAQKKYGIKNILIADWDVHHGDGTQSIFYEDPTVFYFSTHRFGYGYYPGTGSKTEIGTGPGIGTTLNCPFIVEDGDSPRLSILKAFKTTLPQAMEMFAPELILISAGFDAHAKDPLGGCDFTNADFWQITEEIKEIANTYCQGRIISILEGGYSLEGLASAAQQHIESLHTRDRKIS